VEPLLVIRGSGIERNVAEIAVRNLRDTSAHKVVVIKGKGAIRHSLVPEWQVNIKSAQRDRDEHMVFWPDDIQTVREQLLVDFVEQPVASCEATDENDVL
jgi:hypothetical protein